MKWRGEQLVKGITAVAGVTLLTLRGLSMVGVPGIAERLFRALASRGVNVILISQASSEHTICSRGGNAIVQLQYEFPNLPNHDPRPTIGSATLCDIGYATERDDFGFGTYFVPHTFKSVLKPNERVRILLRAEGENAVSNEVLLEIAWSGVWKEDTLQMAKNLVITEISNQAREQ